MAPAATVAEHELPETPGAYDVIFDHADGRYDGRYDLLGFGTGRRPGHTHPLDEYPRPRTRCLACRWTEVRIFAPLDDGPERYLVHTAGRSAVPGERTLHRMLETIDPEEVIQILVTEDRGVPFMPPTSSAALLQASESDRPLETAYAEYRSRTV